MILADKILTLRKQNGWSQEELAEKLGVSRQAISKWEGAQSTPDLDRILKMSELFGVSTDYLMKDDFVGNPTGDQIDGLLPQVSLEDANVFLQARHKSGQWISLGVAILVCSLIPAIIGGSYEGPAATTDLASIIGVIITLILVACGIALFIRAHYLLQDFAWMEKQSFEVGFGVEGLVREQQKTTRAAAKRKILLSMVTLVVGIIFMVAAESLETLLAIPMSIAISLGFFCIAVSMYFLVSASYLSNSYKLLLQEGDYRASKKKVADKTASIMTIYWMVVVSAFLAYSFITRDWGHSWIFFPVAGVLDVALRLLLDVFLVEKAE